MDSLKREQLESWWELARKLQSRYIAVAEFHDENGPTGRFYRRLAHDKEDLRSWIEMDPNIISIYDTQGSTFELQWALERPWITT